MSPAEKALRVLKVTESNILSQWYAVGREVHAPFELWLAAVREAIKALEDDK